MPLDRAEEIQEGRRDQCRWLVLYSHHSWICGSNKGEKAPGENWNLRFWNILLTPAKASRQVSITFWHVTIRSRGVAPFFILPDRDE
jgi:hypothetical protein